jgi:hypothetical protein
MYYVLAHDEARRRAAQACMTAPDGHVVKVAPPTRSLEQNAALWSSLADVAAQVVWHGRKLDAESWKHIFSSSLKKQDVVPNLDGTGFVVLGISTSKMSKREMSDLIELIRAFGAEHGVEWSDDGAAA